MGFKMTQAPQRPLSLSLLLFVRARAPAHVDCKVKDIRVVNTRHCSRCHCCRSHYSCGKGVHARMPAHPPPCAVEFIRLLKLNRDFSEQHGKRGEALGTQATCAAAAASAGSRSIYLSIQDCKRKWKAASRPSKPTFS